MWQHDRAYYRIEYPLTARPDFVPADGAPSRPVVDCSERGFRFGTSEGGLVPEEGSSVAGELRLMSGESVPVAGSVVRVQGGEVAVHLAEEPIPFRLIMREQVFLRRRYPCRAA